MEVGDPGHLDENEQTHPRHVEILVELFVVNVSFGLLAFTTTSNVF